MTDSRRAPLAVAVTLSALFGALLTGFALRHVYDQRSREEQAKRQAEAAETAAAEEARRAAFQDLIDRRDAELEKSRQAIALIQAEEKELKAKLAQAGPRGGPPKLVRKSWKEIAGALAKGRGTVNGFKLQDWPPEAAGLSDEMRKAILALAQELGISLDEALASPGGLPALFLELLAQCEPPPDAATMARMREILASGESDWSKYLAAKDSLTALEQRAAIVKLSDAETAAMRALLSPDQLKYMDAFQVFDQVGTGGPQSWFDGNRATVVDHLAQNWSQMLKLDDAQREAIAPVVAEFVEKSAENSHEIWKREHAGEVLSGQDRFKAQLQLMLETQKKLAEVGRLSAAQQKAMKDWATVYGCNVADWEPKSE